MPTLPGHQRNVSQGQHLIVDRNESDGEEDIERLAGTTRDGACGSPLASSQGVFPGGSPPYEPARPEANKAKGICSDPTIRSNIRVILGSIFLTVGGSILLGVGFYSLFMDDGRSRYLYRK
ncbi:hypothetical protein WR25_04374 isoform B [Diploscapter pachys]|uniref:Transmembrane protein 230 n=1 Tax=Diploscapter pachys TaxID=2018661 RepID=A0A2A2JHK0_9BILA|nr:hypothetical protein WR25_04374 isoform B [Diploscapter pachys]